MGRVGKEREWEKPEEKDLKESSTSRCRTVLYEPGQNFDQLDSSGMFHWCKATPLEKVILKRSDKPKHKFQNHIIACVFGDAQSALMGLRNFVMPLRASNYTRQELKDIVFIGSLDYLKREWRFLRNFPRIYILSGSALYSTDLLVANIEQCSMCAVFSRPYHPSSSQILVDTETIMATLNIGALRVSSSVSSSSVPNELHENPKTRRVPILTELKNPSNIHFIEQLGGLEGSLRGTNLHLSTAFSTGTVFSGNFLDSLLATAFYNYHVLELLQMLVTGGISSQLEQHLDKGKFSDITDTNSSITFLSGRTRCKLGLLSLNETILSDIQPRDTFGQLFCGSLNILGILCVGLYRLIDEEELESNPEHRRFVITRPANEFKLLSSDLVFCAIPFSTDCYKRNNIASSENPYEMANIVSLTSETHADINCLPPVDSISKTITQWLHSSDRYMKPRTSCQSEYEQKTLDQSGTRNIESSWILQGNNMKENGKENVNKNEEETSEEEDDYSSYSQPSSKHLQGW
ncbi:potassium channel subfamily U member 1-like [Carlito syrichta]|uniref:Potassium channel subfamily U member 1-like n=1 Tax=Carlito syrichta TaxID=1868482 RepID=A0A3Q0DZ23_CARSF|nr:potassium channel subfamily U member 1-like [Carlito syrichta]